MNDLTTVTNVCVCVFVCESKRKFNLLSSFHNVGNKVFKTDNHNEGTFDCVMANKLGELTIFLFPFLCLMA